MAKTLDAHSARMRERIAQLAARLIAEDGIQDYALAKRKAARQMGAADTRNLPTNMEIDQAVRAYQQLYQQHEQREHLRLLREQALSIMRMLSSFDPHLTGPVLSGSAARHSDIRFHLFTDNLKEVELFLLNHGIPYKCGEKRYRFGDETRMIPTFTLHGEQAAMHIAVFPASGLHHAPKDPVNGRPMERARIREVERLLNET